MKVHFIAIGGAAMHNLALALYQKGYEVSGSDDAIFDPSKSRLKDHGLLPQDFGWFPEKITLDLDAIILGMHAKSDNPELVKAQSLGIRIYSYPEFIYEQSKDKTRVVVGGSHGKTTITAMILHVLNYHGRSCDYLVGAQLEGFDVMVHLTEVNDFIVLEGDEYSSSALDSRPKFHHYKPNIALISGIAWDHVNVFPTFENYKEQFLIFVDSITSGGSVTYNAEDLHLNTIIDRSENPIRRFPYQTPNASIIEGVTYLETDEGPIPLEIFGAHNLSNLAGAKWICQQMGIDEMDFYEAIGSFSGASKRLEKIAAHQSTLVYKDFAHAPSKVLASTAAVKAQYPNKRLLACLELHTYSSFNESFLGTYKNSLQTADQAVVFYSPKTSKIKKMKSLQPEQILMAFDHPNLKLFTDSLSFQEFLKAQDYSHTVLLLMSSGTFGGLDFKSFQTIVM